MSTTVLDGEPVASAIRESVTDRVAALDEAGVTPTLATVVASDAPAQHRFVDLKHEACAALGVETRDRRLDSDAAQASVVDAVAALNDDPEVDAVFLQTPLPTHVSVDAVRDRFDPAKDVDCFHPENLGRLVGGTPRFVPATTEAVVRLLAHYDVRLGGRHVAIVGRSATIGRPLANRLLWDDAPGNATVTVCHTHTSDLGATLRRADVVVTACGVPGLVDESMLREGAVVVDVSANRRSAGGETTVVGDVDYESAAARASAITPVPGGVGPVTIAALLDNIVRAAERRQQDADGAESTEP